MIHAMKVEDVQKLLATFPSIQQIQIQGLYEDVETEHRKRGRYKGQGQTTTMENK